jgi:hypothetical protein
MIIDPNLLSETQREVGRRRIAAGDARTARIRRRYDAPIADVWDACTDPERIARWFLPVSGDLRAEPSASKATRTARSFAAYRPACLS